LPNDQRYGQQWAIKAIQAEKCWGYFKGNGTVPVYVLDAGIDYLHEDLTDVLATNEDEIPDNFIDDDANGYVDDYQGYDFVTELPQWTDDGDGAPWDSDPYSKAGHGTMVSGLVACNTDNEIGIASLNWNGKLFHLRIASTYNGSIYTLEGDVASAIAYCAKNNARIVSFSYGSTEKTPLLEKELKPLKEKGTLFFAAGGNEFSHRKYYPAAYKEVIAISGVNSAFMNTRHCYGYWIDLSAPGRSIMTTLPDHQYTTGGNGTSLATPIVAGAFSYLCEYYPEMSNQQIYQLVASTCLDIDSVNTTIQGQMGSGLIQVGDALEKGFSNPFLIDVCSLICYDNDTILNPGDEIHLEFDLKNLGSAFESRDFDLELLTDNGLVVTQQPLTTISLEQDESSSFNIQFMLPESVSPQSNLLFKLTCDSPAYHLKKYIYQDLYPVFYHLSSGSLSASFSSVGLFGHNDNSDGSPFHDFTEEYLGRGVNYNSVEDLIYIGSVWFGAENFQVIDGTILNANKNYSEWEIISPLEKTQTEDFKTRLTSIFGFGDIQIEQEIICYDQYHAFEMNFHIVNSGIDLINPRLALFCDWDLVDYAENQIGFDSTRQLSYQYYQNQLYVGIADRSNLNTHYSFIEDYWDYTSSTLNDSIKYTLMNNDSLPSSSGDFAQIISTGTDTLKSNDTLNVSMFLTIAGSMDSIFQRFDQYQEMTPIENNLKTDMKIDFCLYPNPATDELNIKIINLKHHNNPNKIQIYDLTGRIIDTFENIHIKKFKIDISNYSNGIYFVKFNNGVEKPTIKKIKVLH